MRRLLQRIKNFKFSDSGTEDQRPNVRHDERDEEPPGHLRSELQVVVQDFPPTFQRHCWGSARQQEGGLRLSGATDQELPDVQHEKLKK